MNHKTLDRLTGKEERMKIIKIILYLAIIICFIIISAVSYHSVWEIHYLKSFYTGHFTVADAGWASVVELIKVSLASFPLLIIIIASYFLIRNLNENK